MAGLTRGSRTSAPTSRSAGPISLAYGLIFAWLWQNWRVPGLQIAAVGIGANMLAVLVNGGQMPIWSAAYFAAGFTEADIVNDPFHFILRAETVGSFVAQGGLFGDVIPLPIPFIQDVVSIGDVLLALGIFWAIVYSMTRAGAPTRSALAFGQSTLLRPAAVATGTSGSTYTDAERIPAEMTEAQAAAAGVRRESPYLRLVRNRNFSLLWVGQLVSLFGEKIHTIALGFLVYEATGGSALEVGLTFAATAVPNVLLGPLAGTLVDRWNRRTDDGDLRHHPRRVAARRPARHPGRRVARVRHGLPDRHRHASVPARRRRPSSRPSSRSATSSPPTRRAASPTPPPTCWACRWPAS